jgi:hypothetical protein
VLGFLHFRLVRCVGEPSAVDARLPHWAVGGTVCWFERLNLAEDDAVDCEDVESPSWAADLRHY